MFNKSTLTMFAIGGGIATLAFGFSLLSVTKINRPLEYKTGTFKGKIEKVSDIEDLEFANGCKFFFYDPTRITNTELEISDARTFKVEDAKKGEFFKKVSEDIEKCTKDRIIYIKH